MVEIKQLPVTRGRIATLAMLLFAAFALPSAGGASAAPPPLLSQFCGAGGGAGQCSGGARIATDAATGNVYAVDPLNNRINEFTIWGGFVKAFGGGVVNGGAAGTGTLSTGSTAISAVNTKAKAFVPGMLIEGAGIAPGATIASVGVGSLTLSKPATAAATGAPTAISSPEAPNNLPTNELQRITLTATDGSFNLFFTTPEPDVVTQTTSVNLPYNASAAEVQSALEGLSSLGAGNVAVSSPNPGGEAGVPGGPYTVEFRGPRFADTDVRGLRVTGGTPALSGGGAEVAPVRQGASAPEVCTGSDCREGVDGDRPGQFAQPAAIAVDSNSDIYVYENASCFGGESCVETFRYTGHGANRVQKFDSEGNFLLMFGGDVNKGGGSPSNPGDVCTANDIANGDFCGGGNWENGDGEFGGTLDGSLYGPVIASGPGNAIYVGGEERIQKFGTDGTFAGQLPDPQGVLAGASVQALAVDPVSGDLYVARIGKSDVVKLSPAGDVLATLKLLKPTAISTDAAGNVYVLVAQSNPEIVEFSPLGTEILRFSDKFNPASTLATSSACGIGGADVLVGGFDFIRAYGQPPSPAICPPPSLAPAISAQYAVSVGSRDAALGAAINPRFWPDATYYVQYGAGKCSEGGCDNEEPLSPGSALTTAVTSHDITIPGILLDGLQPNTTYHYRFVAQSSGGGPVRGVGGEIGSDGAEGTFSTFPATFQPKTDCPNQQFRAGVSAKLTDCRAYEMVSPVNKNGGDVAAGPINEYGTLGKGAIDGERVTFSALRAFGDPQAAPLIDQYLSVRGAGGWATRSISPPRVGLPFFRPVGETTQSKAFSEDLCSTWTLQDADVSLAPESPPHVPNLYRRENCGAEDFYELLSTVVPPGFGVGKTEAQYYIPTPQGFSADETHTVFRASAALTPNACQTPAIFQVYETTKEGSLRLISALPPGKGGKAPCTQTTAGVIDGAPDGIRKASLSHAVSADGSRVFWTDSGQSAPFSSGTGADVTSGKLYVRVNATEAPSKIVAGKCSQPEGACTQAISESNDTLYQGASRDGETAIYTVGPELFEYDVEEAKSQLIAKGVSGVIGESEDASRVYFISDEALSGGQENSAGAKAQAGKPNVYLAEGGAFTYVATLGSREGTGSDNQKRPSSPGALRPYYRTSRLSPDGLHLAFTSAEPLSGYDTQDAVSGAPDTEVFLYDAAPGAGPGQLACVSCNPSGARPQGRRVITLVEGGGDADRWAAALLPGWSEQLSPTRLLSDDGNRLYFNAFDALLPRDTNGRMDVYEWQRAASAEECRQAGAELFVKAAGGCLSLISTGQSADDSEVIDASAGGRDVFFVTNSSLLVQDPGLYDVYDAREGGGYPAPAVAPPSCEGEACQGPLAPPNDPTPASSAFEGVGNVKQPAKKAKKKAHKKKHAKKKAHKQQRANHERRQGR